METPGSDDASVRDVFITSGGGLQPTSIVDVNSTGNEAVVGELQNGDITVQLLRLRDMVSVQGTLGKMQPLQNSSKVRTRVSRLQGNQR